MHVVDGTFCDSFGSLTHDQQTKVADDLNRPVAEILKKLEDTRNSLL
jgi:hypothetical protein